MTTWHGRGADVIEEIERLVPKAKDAVAYDNIIQLREIGKAFETFGRVLQDIKWLRTGKSSRSDVEEGS